MFNKFLIDFYNFIFPPICLICRSGQQSSQLICPNCNKQLVTAEQSDFEIHFKECFASTGNIEGLYSLYLFSKDSPIQVLLHKLKYENKFRLGLKFGNMWAERFAGINDLKDLDCIIPVPLFHTKRAERGYNQSLYFAKGISKILRVKINTNQLKRVRQTKTQTHFSKAERLLNVRGAFKVSSSAKLAGKKILLLDDVITTGSTINECARVLTEAGVKSIVAGSIALA